MSGNETPAVGNGEPAEVPIERDAYPVDEAAERLGVSPATAWRLIRAGRLRAKRLGGRTLVTPEAIKQLLAETPDREPAGAA